MKRQALLRALINIQYERNDNALEHGRFRVRGDTVDVIPRYEETIIRIDLRRTR